MWQGSPLDLLILFFQCNINICNTMTLYCDHSRTRPKRGQACCPHPPPTSICDGRYPSPQPTKNNIITWLVVRYLPLPPNNINMWPVVPGELSGDWGLSIYCSFTPCHCLCLNMHFFSGVLDISSPVSSLSVGESLLSVQGENLCNTPTFSKASCHFPLRKFLYINYRQWNANIGNYFSAKRRI